MKEINFNKEKKKNFILLLLNTLFSWLAIVFIVVAYLLYMYIKPFPERLYINEMDQNMIEQGQAKNLIILVSIIIFAIIFTLLMFSFNIIVLHYYFVKMPYQIKKENQLESRKNIILWYFLEGLFIFFYLILSPFMIIYFWLVYFKEYNNKFQNLNLLLNKNQIYLNKKSKTWFFALTLTAIPTISGIASFSYLFSPHIYVSNITNQNLSKCLTVSKNNKNVFIFYFDRAQSYLWNALLYIDFIINKNNSFIQLFPEFNSFTKTISLSNLTRLSTPSMYSGYEFAPWVNSFSNSGPVYDKTQNEIVFQGLKNLVQMCGDHNFKNISFDNVPYYGEKYEYCGEMSTLYEDFKKDEDIKNKNLDIETTTNYDLAYSKMGLKTINIQNQKIAEQYVIDNLPNFLEFKETKTGVFNWYFFQNTHVWYNVKINNNYLCKSNSDWFIPSMWQSIQGLKNILRKFKEEKTNKNESVYDNTMFLIVSDHGYQLKHYYHYFYDILNYLYDNKHINENTKNNILNFENFGFNPVFMIKKFKQRQDQNLIKENKNLKTIVNNFFINNKLLCLADIPYIIEHEMDAIQNKQTTNETSHFRSKFLNENNPIAKFINNQISLSPLEDSNINKRKFILSLTNDWRFYANKKSWDIYKNFYYVLKNNNYFQNENFNDFKK